MFVFPLFNPSLHHCRTILPTHSLHESAIHLTSSKRSRLFVHRAPEERDGCQLHYRCCSFDWVADSEWWRGVRPVASWNIYMYEILGGNNSQTALSELCSERADLAEDQRYTRRMVSIYINLTDKEAQYLAIKHYRQQSFIHQKIRYYNKVL